MPGHSSVLMALGCFSLWFGWIAFNIGSVTSIVSDPDAPSRVAATTMLAGAAGGITVLLRHDPTDPGAPAAGAYEELGDGMSEQLLSADSPGRSPGGLRSRSI